MRYFYRKHFWENDSFSRKYYCRNIPRVFWWKTLCKDSFPCFLLFDSIKKKKKKKVKEKLSLANIKNMTYF